LREKERQVRYFSPSSLQHARSARGRSLDEASQRFEAQLFGQLLSYQQENFTDAFRLNNLATTTSSASSGG